VGNTASLAAYGQNAAFYQALVGAGIKSTATDASKQYPDTSVASNPFGLTVTGAALLPAGASFTEGTGAAAFQAIPRYPSNVYYNVSKQSQQLDEYNWIYYSGAPTNGTVNDGGCAAHPHGLPDDAGHLGRLPRQREPDHVRPPDGQRPAAALHPSEQSRRLESGTAGDRSQPGRDPLRGHRRPARQLVRQVLRPPDARRSSSSPRPRSGPSWRARRSGRRTWPPAGSARTCWTASCTCPTTADMQVPLTGTTVGDVYGGQRSGLATVKAGTEAVFSPDGTPVVQPPVSTPQSRPARRAVAGPRAARGAGAGAGRPDACRPAGARGHAARRQAGGQAGGEAGRR
jgi:hypothetical protein